MESRPLLALNLPNLAHSDPSDLTNQFGISTKELLQMTGNKIHRYDDLIGTPLAAISRQLQRSLGSSSLPLRKPPRPGTPLTDASPPVPSTSAAAPSVHKSSLSRSASESRDSHDTSGTATANQKSRTITPAPMSASVASSRVKQESSSAQRSDKEATTLVNGTSSSSPKASKDSTIRSSHQELLDRDLKLSDSSSEDNDTEEEPAPVAKVTKPSNNNNKPPSNNTTKERTPVDSKPPSLARHKPSTVDQKPVTSHVNNKPTNDASIATTASSKEAQKVQVQPTATSHTTTPHKSQQKHLPAKSTSSPRSSTTKDDARRKALSNKAASATTTPLKPGKKKGGRDVKSASMTSQSSTNKTTDSGINPAPTTETNTSETTQCGLSHWIKKANKTEPESPALNTSEEDVGAHGGGHTRADLKDKLAQTSRRLRLPSYVHSDLGSHSSDESDHQNPSISRASQSLSSSDTSLSSLLTLSDEEADSDSKSLPKRSAKVHKKTKKKTDAKKSHVVKEAVEEPIKKEKHVKEVSSKSAPSKVKEESHTPSTKTMKKSLEKPLKVSQSPQTRRPFSKQSRPRRQSCSSLSPSSSASPHHRTPPPPSLTNRKGETVWITCDNPKRPLKLCLQLTTNGNAFAPLSPNSSGSTGNHRHRHRHDRKSTGLVEELESQRSDLDEMVSSPATEPMVQSDTEMRLQDLPPDPPKDKKSHKKSHSIVSSHSEKRSKTAPSPAHSMTSNKTTHSTTKKTTEDNPQTSSGKKEEKKEDKKKPKKRQLCDAEFTSMIGGSNPDPVELKRIKLSSAQRKQLSVSASTLKTSSKTSSGSLPSSTGPPVVQKESKSGSSTSKSAASQHLSLAPGVSPALSLSPGHPLDHQPLSHSSSHSHHHKEEHLSPGKRRRTEDEDSHSGSKKSSHSCTNIHRIEQKADYKSKPRLEDCGMQTDPTAPMTPLPSAETPTPAHAPKKPSAFALVIQSGGGSSTNLPSDASSVQTPGEASGGAGGSWRAVGPPELKNISTGEIVLALLDRWDATEKRDIKRCADTTIEVYRDRANHLKREADVLESNHPEDFPPAVIRAIIQLVLLCSAAGTSWEVDRISHLYTEVVNKISAWAARINKIYLGRIQRASRCDTTGLECWRRLYLRLCTQVKAILCYRQYRQLAKPKELTTLNKSLMEYDLRDMVEHESSESHDGSNTPSPLPSGSTSRETAVGRLKRFMFLSKYLHMAHDYWEHAQNLVDSTASSSSRLATSTSQNTGSSQSPDETVLELESKLIRSSGVHLMGIDMSVQLLVRYLQAFLRFQEEIQQASSTL